MSTNNRRKFIKNSLLALSSAPILTTQFSQINNKKIVPEPDIKIVTRTLGKTGLQLPVISMGTGDTDNPKLIEAALEKGVKLLATSQYYGNGNNEAMLGKALKGKKRDSYLIATSAMPDGFDHKSGTFTGETNGNAFLKKFEDSLKRLETDYVDIMFLPFMAKKESVFQEEYLKVMEKIKKDGKARFIGIATHKFEHEAIRAAVDVKIYDLVMMQYNFRRTNINDIKESIDYAATKGLGIIAMKTMAGAFWDKERTKPINSKAALKWVLQNENIHTTVPGITSFDQLQQDMELMANMQLTEQEKADLIAISENPTGLFCQQCGECLPQCPKSVDVPTIMRSYMYAYGYKNLNHAQQTLIQSQCSNDCDSCSTCMVKCTMGFDVKTKIQDIQRLKTVPVEFMG